MYTLLSLLAIPLAAATWAPPFFGTGPCPDVATVQKDLGKQLSQDCSITSADQAPQRWTEYGAPVPHVIVNVASEDDVSAAVYYANSKGMRFLAQGGGNGWANTFDLGDCGMLISLKKLNSIEFNHDKTSALVGGAAINSELVAAAYANDARFSNPTCNCVGFIGGVLGGGINRLSGLYGWGVDQIESANVVLASGDRVTASKTENSELFWALRGAAANFGIVTSATVKAYPIPKEQNVGWQGTLVFADDKVEQVVTAINNLKLQPEMQVDLLFTNTGPPNLTPQVHVLPLYIGSVADAEKAFKPILDIGPIENNAVALPYSEWSTFSNAFCTKGQRKTTYGLSSRTLNPQDWTKAYAEYKAFLAEHGESVAYSSILAEVYNKDKGLELDDGSSSFPFRDIPIHTVVIPWYADASFDSTAEAWADKVRALLRANDGVDGNSTYINFGRGDETLKDVYGDSLPRLQVLKKIYDPWNRFSQWYPLTKRW